MAIVDGRDYIFCGPATPIIYPASGSRVEAYQAVCRTCLMNRSLGALIEKAIGTIDDKVLPPSIAEVAPPETDQL